MRLKVFSYNIHKGYGFANRSFLLSEIREAVRSVGADLVLLQEVRGLDLETDYDQHPFASSAQFEYLADSIWSHFAYGKNAVTSGGHHGNAILSKYPILWTENFDISAHRFENRGLLHAVIDLTPKVHVLCSHLGLFEVGRHAQLKRIADHLKAVIPPDEPVILAGDFNDWRERLSQPFLETAGLHEAFEVLEGRHASTFPSWLPILRLDRIYFRGFKPLKVQTLTGQPWSSLSDHLPLLGEFGREPG